MFENDKQPIDQPTKLQPRVIKTSPKTAKDLGIKGILVPALIFPPDFFCLLLCPPPIRRSDLKISLFWRQNEIIYEKRQVKWQRMLRLCRWVISVSGIHPILEDVKIEMKDDVLKFEEKKETAELMACVFAMMGEALGDAMKNRDDV